MINSCNYLFGKSAEEIFNTKQFDEKLINDSLQTLIKVSDLLSSKPEALFLFDPTAFNDQCHLYALMTIQKKTEKRYFHLTFLLNYGFLTDGGLLEKVITKHAQDPLPEPRKKFSTFLKDPGGSMRKAARIALNELFEKYIKNAFTLNEGEELYKDLIRLSEKDLRLMPSHSKGASLYTLPKFAGVAYFVDKVAKEKIPLLFRVKVLSEKGVGSFTFCRNGDLQPNTPVIAFELFASNSLTTVECVDLAEKCPRYSERNQSRKDRHIESKTCLFCTPNRVDVTLYKERFLPVLEKMDQMLFALGADFILKHQNTFRSHFENQTEFPTLTHLFQKAKPNIEKFSLSRTDKGCMSVSHVQVDLFSSKSFLMDATYETHLKERGLI